MGGLNPPYEPSPRLVFPPKRPSGPKTPFGCHGSQGQTLRGVFSGVVPPQMAPLISGLLGFAGECSLVAIVTEFYRFFGLSCSDYS